MATCWLCVNLKRVPAQGQEWWVVTCPRSGGAIMEG